MPFNARKCHPQDLELNHMDFGKVVKYPFLLHICLLSNMPSKLTFFKVRWFCIFLKFYTLQQGDEWLMKLKTYFLQRRWFCILFKVLHPSTSAYYYLAKVVYMDVLFNWFWDCFPLFAKTHKRVVDPFK